MSIDFKPPAPQSNFVETAYELCAGMPWLRNQKSFRVPFSTIIQLDASGDYLRLGVLQGFPSYCEEEALPEIGLDRKIRRGPTEPVEMYRRRLKYSKTHWRKAGIPHRILSMLAAHHAPNPPIIRYVVTGLDQDANPVTDWWTFEQTTTTGDWWLLETAPENFTYHREPAANWDWDGETADFRFWIIMYRPLLSPWEWDESGRTWDEPGLLWDYADGGYVYDVFNLIDDWKCMGSHLGGLIVTPDTSLFDPTAAPGYPQPAGDWNDPANRHPDAQYLFVHGD